MLEVAIKAEKGKKTSLHKLNNKAKLNEGRSLAIKKKHEGRKIYKLKSNVEGTSYFPM